MKGNYLVRAEDPRRYTIEEKKLTSLKQSDRVSRVHGEPDRVSPDRGPDDYRRFYLYRRISLCTSAAALQARNLRTRNCGGRI